MTTDRLVARAQAGQTAAFDELMVRHEKLVCKVAMGYTGDRQSALDVTQDVFLKAFRHLDRVRAEGMFKPWLLRITYNESVNWIRKQRRHAAQERTGPEPTTAPEDGQEAAVLRVERQRRVLDGLGRLNPKYRLALSLRYAEGLRVREIADVMECSEGMVKSLLFRGVRRIREEITGSA